jgi:hypothetical protein
MPLKDTKLRALRARQRPFQVADGAGLFIARSCLTASECGALDTGSTADKKR